MALPGSPKQDRNGVRSALDLERKYDFSSLIGIKKAIKLNDAGLTKTNKILEDFIQATVSDIGDLQKQMDGKIETWFYEGEPTLENEPANQWPVTSYAEHQGDLYYDKLTGYAYRFLLEGDSYVWMKLSDSDVTEALAIANAASDTADSKRRVFVDVPVPPYDNGDLWFYNGEIFICQISKGEGEIYETKDFITATKYTDDTEAHKVGDELTVVKGTVLTIQENHEMFKVEIKTTVSGIGSDLEVAKTTIEANTNEIDLRVRKDGVIGAINLTEEAAKIQASKIELEGAVTMTALDSNLQDTISGYGARLSVLNNQISAKVWKQDIDDTVDDISIGSRNLIRQKDIVNFQGTTDSSAFTESGTITHTSAHAHGGFSFDSISCYEIDTEYVLSGYVTVTTGPVGNFYIYNGKKHVFKSFSIDGVKSGSPLNSGVTAFNAILDDGKKHYFELQFVTASSIPADSGANYTYIQLGKYFDEELSYTISGLKLEKGNKATDWTPAPEDTESQISELSTKHSELELSLEGFRTTVESTYATVDAVNAIDIGGVNILPDSNIKSLTAVAAPYNRYISDAGVTTQTMEFVDISDAPISEISVGIKNVISSTSNSGKNLSWRRIHLQDGETYTMSLYARCTDAEKMKFRFRWLVTNGSYVTKYVTVDMTGKWQRVSCTFTIDKSKSDADDTTDLYTIGIAGCHGTYVGTVEMCGFKMERGNKATAWSYALEDTKNELTFLSDNYTSIKQMVDEISLTVSSHTELIQQKASTSVVASISQTLTSVRADLEGFKVTVSEKYATNTSVEGQLANYSTTTEMLAEIAVTESSIMNTVSETYTSLEEFNALDIGGKNLIPNSADWNDFECPLGSTIYATDFAEVIPGEQITISYEVKSEVEYTASIGLIEYSKDGNKRSSYVWHNGTVSTEYSKLHTTVTVPTGVTYVRLGLRSTNGYVNTYRHIKIERGNKATDWTPAPEDAQAEIMEVKTIATQNADKFNWLVSGESETSFTLTDRMAELTTQLVSLNADVQVNGDMIVDGAITANKIAIGDFTNLAVINPDNYNPYPHTVTEDDSGVKWFQFGSDTKLGYYTIYMNTMSNQATFKKGDKYLFRGLVRASQATSVRVCLRALYTAGGYLNMASAFYDSVTTEAQYIEIPFEVVSLPVKPVKYYSLFLETRNTKLGILYARELSVHQMTGNVLIADGSITAEKLYVEDLSALNATIGGWKIATKYISNDALDSEGYVRRAFIQSMSAHEAEDTWVFSVQKSKELGDYEGTFSSVWRVLGSGDMYSEGLISVGGYVYAGEHISTGGYISAEDYILAQNFIRTKSYLRADDVLKVYGGTEDGSYSFIQGKLSLGTTSYNNDYTLLVSGDTKISGDLNLLGTFLGNVSTLGDVVTSEGASLNSLNSRFKWYSSSNVSSSHEYVLMDAGFYAIVLIDSLSTTVRSKPSLAILYTDGTGNGWVNFWQGTGSELYSVQYNSGRLQMVLEESRYLSMGYINLKQ